MSDLPIISNDAQPIVIVDASTNTTVANVKAGSTAATAADNALVVALSPNSPVPAGANAIGSVSVSNFPALSAVNLTQLNSVALGSPSNYGTSPGVVSVQGVNAFITNTPAVTLASTTLTGTSTVAGNLTNNNAAPIADNLGVLPALANAASPTWTEGDQVLLSEDLSGRLRVRGTLTPNSAAPAADGQMTLTVIANAAAPSYTEGRLVLASVDLSGSTRIIGTRTNNSTAPSFQVGVMPALANAAAPTWTEGNQVLLSTDLAGNLRVLDLDAYAQASTTAGQLGSLSMGAVTTNAPAYTTAQTDPLSLNLFGQLRTETTLGNTAGKTVVMKTGTLVTTAVTADQVVLTYTVTAGKTFYVEYVNMAGAFTTPANTNTALGTINLENPFGTKVTSARFVNSNGGLTNGSDDYTFAEPIPIAAGVTIRIVVTPVVATSITWIANFGGYER